MARIDHKIDRDLFHVWLWANKRSRNMVSMTQVEIAERLQCSVHTPSRLFSELIKEGKLKKVNNKLIQVQDPDEFYFDD
jgi:CRP-like cAMP-binding protein